MADAWEDKCVGNINMGRGLTMMERLVGMRCGFAWNGFDAANGITAGGIEVAFDMAGAAVGADRDLRGVLSGCVHWAGCNCSH